MGNHSAIVIGLALAVCVAVPAAVVADYYDSFSDDSFWQGVEPNDSVYYQGDPLPGFDPNLWDIDDPHWTFYPLLCESAFAQVAESQVVPRALRITCDAPVFFPTDAAFAAGVNDGILDANTSMTYFDDSASCYLLCRAYNTEALGGDPNDPNGQDPNLDKGSLNLVILADDLHWTGYRWNLDLHNKAYPGSPWPPSEYYTTFTAVSTGNGTTWHQIKLTNLDQADPNWADIDVWERTGLWMLCQFESDGVSGDPNGKYIRAAIWGGDKYDWDGTWILQVQLNGEGWHTGGLNPLEWYWSSGGSAVAAWPSRDWSNGFPGDVGYDEFEVRTGTFSNSPRSLSLTVKNAQMGTITIDPDLRDPNDPNEPGNILGRYTEGTEIVLAAEAVSGKSFKSWKVFDPNHPGESAYAVQDTNSILYLTMNADWEIEAAFKCGSSEILLPIAGVLVALTLSVVGRRIP